jgi:hypothetical protein
MSLVILQPCAEKVAKQHFDETIKGFVNISLIEPYVTQKQLEELQSIYPDGNVTVWGVTPGKNDSNVKKWKKVNPGDVTLFSAHKRIFASATTTYTLQNKELAAKMWGYKGDGKDKQTWEYIYFVSEVMDQDISVGELNKSIPYKENNNIQGFTVLDEVQSSNALLAFDLYSERFVKKVDENEYYTLIKVDHESKADNNDNEKQRKKLKDQKYLDSEYLAKRRKEQAFLRNNLFGTSQACLCVICNRSYPVGFLVAAHIKKRSNCTEDEKRDFNNIVTSMCKLGCDDLYEKGYIGVEDGTVVRLKGSDVTDGLIEDIDKIVGNKCSAWNDSTKGYFEWHVTMNPK